MSKEDFIEGEYYVNQPKNSWCQRLFKNKKKQYYG